MLTRKVKVTQVVEVTVDETKFDKEFLDEFRKVMYPFYDIEDHMLHLAQLHARGVHCLDWPKMEFVEGYGPAEDMGIKCRTVEQDQELED